ncbi:hypothetical protein DFH07DRAFT_937392 [Mycena maculata]|uniref:Uncharacterized protein n=1 Tax=Mycena maculata TaxID=230809 RepID=A0AAD7K1D0_9AGAR|nr:hypothetical protein DFH07DRAFT_937392 [Mycena maculata]
MLNALLVGSRFSATSKLGAHHQGKREDAKSFPEIFCPTKNLPAPLVSNASKRTLSIDVDLEQILRDQKYRCLAAEADHALSHGSPRRPPVSIEICGARGSELKKTPPNATARGRQLLRSSREERYPERPSARRQGHPSQPGLKSGFSVVTVLGSLGSEFVEAEETAEATLAARAEAQDRISKAKKDYDAFNSTVEADYGRRGSLISEIPSTPTSAMRKCCSTRRSSARSGECLDDRVLMGHYGDEAVREALDIAQQRVDILWGNLSGHSDVFSGVQNRRKPNTHPRDDVIGQSEKYEPNEICGLKGLASNSVKQRTYKSFSCTLSWFSNS